VKLTVGEDAAGKRVDLFVGEQLKLSRAKLKALFEAEKVRVAGRKAKKGQALVVGQVVEVEAEAEAPVDVAVVPEPDAPLEVLQQDEQLIFVNKPARQAVHPLKAGELGTVANALVARFPECATAGADPRECGFCHRLDLETSGVLLAARDRASWEAMREQISEGEADKRYLALVTGPLADDGEIDVRLEHAGDHVRPSLSEGREARSEFRVVARAGEYSLVDVRIFTGVLHQVRAHLAAIGAPIVGDALYGGKAEPGLSRFWLHAAALTVKHPKSGKLVTVKAPLPAELQSVLTAKSLS
jgi:23S rRNA pseudouridine1911/1915/1917 synthase